MTTIFLSIAIVLLSALGLAVGVLFGREPIKGSCGGLACQQGGGCEGCPNNR